MIKSIDLIDSALRQLADEPTQADLRRAASSAYSAVFHHACAAYAEVLLGANAEQQQDVWVQAYRFIDHGPARQRCAEAATGSFSSAIKAFARAFIHLQQKRIEADYAPLTHSM